VAEITLHGTPCRTSGDLPRVGDVAPDFRLVDGKLAEATLATFAGKTKIVSILPSLDTSVCALSTRKFSERLAGRSDAVLLVVSADLPFAMKRFCSGEKLDNAVPLSMMRGRGFAKDYGMLIVDGPFEGLTGRAVVVIDRDDRIVHAELVGEIADEPDYDAALAAAR
jgi:thioredoxin-dependent peroxiredoxin